MATFFFRRTPKSNHPLANIRATAHTALPRWNRHTLLAVPGNKNPVRRQPQQASMDPPPTGSFRMISSPPRRKDKSELIVHRKQANEPDLESLPAGTAGILVVAYRCTVRFGLQYSFPFSSSKIR